MNAKLVVKCPVCKQQYVYAIDADDHMQLDLNLEVRICNDCEERQEQDDWDMSRELDVRNQEQLYGDGWREARKGLGLAPVWFEPDEELSAISLGFEAFMEQETTEHALYMMD